MKYHKRWSEDYLGATRGLSLMEHGAYTLLLDQYYLTERPLPDDKDTLHRLCGAVTKAEQAAVLSVLKQHWRLTTEGWTNSRAEEELAAIRERSEKARAAGRKGGRPRKEHNVVSFGGKQE